MVYPRHIVSAAALIRKGESVLLVRSPKRGWEIPGGPIQVGEAILPGLEREIFGQARVRVTMGRLAGVYTNLKRPVRVLFDFLGEWKSGEITPGDDRLEVAWATPDEALELVSDPAYRSRLSHLLSFKGPVVYQVYTNPPFKIHQERLI